MAFAAIDQGAVIGVALAEIEFAADHRVAGLGIAVNLDALDIEPFALVDGVDQVYQVASRQALIVHGHVGERLAAFGKLHRQVPDGLIHRVGVVDFAGWRAQIRHQFRRGDGL